MTIKEIDRQIVIAIIIMIVVLALLTYMGFYRYGVNGAISYAIAGIGCVAIGWIGSTLTK